MSRTGYAAPIRKTVTKAAKSRRTHYAPEMLVVGSRGPFLAACGSNAQIGLLTAHPHFVTCERCKKLLPATPKQES